MGKTALHEHLAWYHFDSSATSFLAHKAWGCVLIPFAARDFAMPGDDRPDPDWVINAAKQTLARFDLPFEDETLLRRMLRKGTLGIAIDGLHEVNRTAAVEAFARLFPAAPLFITSQEAASSSHFECWNLPADMRDFALNLLLVLSGDISVAQKVASRIEESGLINAIRSGYDVRLVYDLSRNSGNGPPDDHAFETLPSNRVGLYQAVIRGGWPLGSHEEVLEQQRQVAAAAWRMVS